MVRPDDITGFLDNRWFDSLGGLGAWTSNILISLVCLVVLYYIYTIFEHKIKVTVFPVYGADPHLLKDVKSISDLKNIPNLEIGMPNKTKGKLYEASTSSPISKIIQLGHPKILRGKDVKVKRTPKFSIIKKLFITQKLQNIEYDYRYNDGIWMLNPAKDVYIPIRRPTLLDTINLKVPDHDMDLWQQAEESEIRRRTQDENTMKVQMYATVAIIIGAFALAGLIIWLSMSFGGKSLNDVLTQVGPLTESIRNLGGNVPAPG